MFARPSIPQICFVKGKGRRRRYPIVLTSPLKSGRWNELRKLDADRLLDRGRRLSLLVFWLGRCRSPFPWVGLEGRRPLQPVLSVIELLMTTSIHRFTDADVLEEINSVSSNSPGSGLPPPLRASSEGTSQVDPSAHLPDVHETSSWRFLYDNEVPILENPERLALIWRKI